MDSDGLPLVGPGIDYTKVEAINQKRTIALINHFITHTSRFLNHFANVCEDKLEHLHGRCQQLEISLSILEAKLASIPGLESVTAPQSSTTATSTDAGQAPGAAPTGDASAAPPAPPAPPGPPPPPGGAPATDADSAPAEAPAEEAAAQNPVSKDPRYVKYFKMLQYGVPPPVVKGKMGMEGLDPELLDTPDAPAPPNNAPAAGGADSDSDQSGSDASFSD
ncbi:WASH complex subunit 3 [Elysia marginata]|uniref:WASH complex subunit 3 n=1 Tax=Elysia marginata TaxID=1093978 RepID=A0AAV4GAW0_9GAST|nr:WASH complex subunit 3 [Elysia marginata]